MRVRASGSRAVSASAALSLALALAALLPAWAGDPPPAAVALDPAKVDLGSIPLGQPARRTVAVRNAAPSAVRFAGRRDTSPFIGVVVVPATIPPGASAEATILVAPRATTGVLDETVRLAFTGEAGESVLDLRVEGEVCAYFLLEPGRLDFGIHVDGTPPRECVLRIDACQREDVEIRGFDLPEGMTVTARERVMKEGRPGVRLSLSYDPAGGPGSRSGAAGILLGGPRVPRLDVPWACLVRRELEAGPAVVDVGKVVRGGARATARVRVSSCLGRPVRVLGLAVTGTALALASAGPPAAQVDVDLTVDPSRLPAGQFAASALLAVDRPSQPVVGVAVTGEVLAPVEADPPALVVISGPGEAGEGLVHLRAREGAPAPAYGAPVLGAPGATVGAVARGRDLEVRVRFSPVPGAGTTDGSLRIPLGIAGETDLIVPVYWIRR